MRRRKTSSLGAALAGHGGTGAAASCGADATYTNPALLSLVHHNVLTWATPGPSSTCRPAAWASPAGLGHPGQGVRRGAEVPIPFGGFLKDRVAVGMAFYTPTDALLRGNILYPETPSSRSSPIRAQSLAVRIGAGVDVGTASASAPGGRAGGARRVDRRHQHGGSVGAKVDDQLIATYAPTIGLAYDLPFDRAPDGSSRWRLGATWRGKLDATFGVNVDASKLSSINLPVFNIAGVAQYDPGGARDRSGAREGRLDARCGHHVETLERVPRRLRADHHLPREHGLHRASRRRYPYSDTIVPAWEPR